MLLHYTLKKLKEEKEAKAVSEIPAVKEKEIKKPATKKANTKK